MSSQGTPPSDKKNHQSAQILLSKYVASYTKVHGRKPVINRYTAKWGMLDVLESLDYDRTVEVMEYYFKTGGDHSLQVFYKTFDKLDNNLTIRDIDRKSRAKILEETKQRVEGSKN